MGAFEQSDRRHGIEYPGEFAHLRHVRLTEKYRPVKIDAAGDEIEREVDYPFPERLRIRVGGERVVVGDEKETLAFVLKCADLADRPEIISEVRRAGRLYSGQYSHFIFPSVSSEIYSVQTLAPSPAGQMK